MSRRALVFAACVGSLSCVRSYAPVPVNVPLLRKQGQVTLALDGGFHGSQVSGAYAVTDHVQVRGFVNGNLGARTPHGLVGGGVGWHGVAADVSESAWLAPLAGALSLSVGVGGTPGDRERTEQVALQAEGGARWPHGQIALALRTTYAHIDHGLSTPAYPRHARGVLLEPTLVLGAGTERLHLNVQAGVSVPVWRHGSLGAEWPLLLSAGISYDY